MSISAPGRSFGARPYNDQGARIFDLPRPRQRNIRRLYGAKTGLVELAWSDWRPLAGAGRDRRLPKSPGLYRIRCIDTQQLLYIGQTGRSLRQRLGSLSGVYGAEIPYNDPHTVGPALWALRQDDQCDFEASVSELDGDTRSRLEHECVEISMHRVRYGHSPAFNFGHMPSGWVKSSGNNARLVAAGKRFHGYRDPNTVVVPHAPPPRTLHDDPCATEWMQFPWRPVSASPPHGISTGVYRARIPGQAGLVYLGQGLVAQRIADHTAKSKNELHRQQTHFSADLIWEWVDLNGTHRTQLLEIENDLIASHIITQGAAPSAQFLG